MQQYQDNVTDQYGNAQSGASVLVKTAAGATATIYSDDGVTTKANPITTGSNGAIEFYAANGTYVLNIDGIDSTRFTLLDVTEADTATPLSSSTVVGETGGVVKRFPFSYTPSGTGGVARTISDKLSDVVSVKDFGPNTSAGSTDMAPAINYALADRGEIYLPDETLNILSTITVGDGQKIHGAGSRTIITPSLGAGVPAFTVGNSANNVLSYGCQVTDLKISPRTAYPNTIGVLLYSTVGANIANIEIQPETVDLGITAIKLDGGYSAFFNVFQNILANHCHVGFHMTTTGVSYPTSQTFIGCSSFGDVGTGDPTSVGFLFDNVSTNSCGMDSIILGGNVEQCGIGVSIVDFNSLSVQGLRFEGNTKDITGGSLTQNCVFFACKNIDSVDTFPLYNVGYGKNAIIECTGTYGLTNRQARNHVHYAPVASETPRILVGAVAQTAPLEQWTDSSNNVLAQINANGNITIGGVLAAANTLTLKGTAQTTVGAAGGASALPGAPTGYLIADKAGTAIVIPYWLAS